MLSSGTSNFFTAGQSARDWANVIGAMAEEERNESEGFTEAVDPSLEPGEIPADLLEERAEASEG